MEEEIKLNDEKNTQEDSVSGVLGFRDYVILVGALFIVLILASAWASSRGLLFQPQNKAGNQEIAALQEKVIPSSGVRLPIRWGDLGIKMTEAGVIDKQKFESFYISQNEFDAVKEKMIESYVNDDIVITPENSGFLLNLFWALGLGNKNRILENGPTSDPRYGGIGDFASTGGWTLARGKATDHFSRHEFINLTEAQQVLVGRVSKNIYRPCCDNSTYFPDCNHGMAMLGLLELTASQGVGEDEMYKIALEVNSYWFPDTYLTIAKYLREKGIMWDSVDPKNILSKTYSSASGYREILKQVTVPAKNKGGSCGI